VGAYGYVLTYLSLNGATSQGLDSCGTYPILKNPGVRPGAWVCAEPGHKDKAGWADWWQNLAYPQSPRWGKGLV
jgi:hypothetical protein